MRSYATLRRQALPVVAMAALMVSGPGAVAQLPQDAGFQGYLQLLAAKARAAGVSEATIQQVAQGLSFNPRVIELDRSQPGANPKAPPPAFEP